MTEIVEAKLSDLTPDGDNANAGTERGLGMLETSLRKRGAGRSILIDRNRRIIGGNKTTERAAAIGLEDVIIVKTDGTKLVAVQREDLDLDDPATGARELAYLDNRVSEVDLLWKPEQIAADLERGLDLGEMWSKGELEAILAEVNGNRVGEDIEPQIDKAAELQKKWGTATGQVWELGAHRVVCGDCTDKAVVEAVMREEMPLLMVTDPPYGVEYDPHWRDDIVGDFGQRMARGNGVLNDNQADWTTAWSFFRGDIVYVWHADRHAKQVQISLENCGFEIRNQIIWAKQHFAISRGNYHWKHEPCWYAIRKGKSASFIGDRTQTTLWEISSLNPAGRIEERFAHGTQKPLECMSKPIQNHGKKGDIIYDPFLGSGTTLIACHDLGRQCRGIEISPEYVAVTLQRFFDHTKIEPRLIEG